METRKILVLSVSFAILMCLIGCTFVFAPSSDEKQSKAVVSIALGALDADKNGSVSRAIIQGSGYLYIRTIGGPTGSSGPFYGPYSVSSGSTFTTTDIPAGSYSRLFVLYSAKELDSTTKYAIMGGSYTFRELMTVSDDLMIKFLDEDNSNTSDPGKDALGNSFEGMASFGEKQNITLSAGETTNLSMILTPISGADTEIRLYENPLYTFTSASAGNRFYRLEGINVSLPVTAGGLFCTLFSSTDTSGSIGSVAFYNADGKPVATTRSGSSLSGGYTWSMDAASITGAASSTGYVELYIYIEHTGTVYGRFANTVPPNVFVSIDGDATVAWKGHKVLFGIYDTSCAANIAAGQSMTQQVPVGLGIINLDATTGDGALEIKSSSLNAGSTYYISAQVDSGDHYATLTSFTGVDLATLIPYQNDYLTNASNGLIPFTAGSAVLLSTANFSQYNTYVYFASMTGGGSGSLPSSPMTFPAAIVAANALATTDSAQIYVTGDISGIATNPSATNYCAGVSRPVSVQSYGSSVHTLTSYALGSTNNFFSITAAGKLRFERISLDCSSLTGVMMPLFSAAGPLEFGPGTTLTGTSGWTSYIGGGVYSTVSFTMNGATIKDCSAHKGAAIYVGGGTCTVSNSVISGCNATDGAGVTAVVHSVAGATFTQSNVTWTSNSPVGNGWIQF